MVKNIKKWKAFENHIQTKERLSYAQKCKIFDSLYQEARTLGILPSRDPLEGLEGVFRLAKALSKLPTHD